MKIELFLSFVLCCVLGTKSLSSFPFLPPPPKKKKEKQEIKKSVFNSDANRTAVIPEKDSNLKEKAIFLLNSTLEVSIYISLSESQMGMLPIGREDSL